MRGELLLADWWGMGGVALLASHRCGPMGPLLGHFMLVELSCLLVLSLAKRVFLRFSSLRKNQHFKFQFDRNEGHNEN
jgi:hypothetical protein